MASIISRLASSYWAFRFAPGSASNRSGLPNVTTTFPGFGKPLRFEAARGADRKAQYEVASRQMMDAISRLRNGIIAGTGQGRPGSVRVVGSSSGK